MHELIMTALVAGGIIGYIVRGLTFENEKNEAWWKGFGDGYRTKLHEEHGDEKDDVLPE